MVFPCIEEANPSKNERCFCGHDCVLGGGQTQPVASFFLKCWGPMDVHHCFAVSVSCGSKFRFDWLEQGQKQTTANNTNNTSSNKNNKWVFPKIGVPQDGWLKMENSIKMDDLGVPLFSETPKSLASKCKVQYHATIFCACHWYSPPPRWLQNSAVFCSSSNSKQRSFHDDVSVRCGHPRYASVTWGMVVVV